MKPISFHKTTCPKCQTGKLELTDYDGATCLYRCLAGRCKATFERFGGRLVARAVLVEVA
jgi:hypothetical protein